MLALAGPIWGKDPKPFTDFTFKRIKPPASGTANRITVQIVPRPQTVPEEPAAEVSPESAPGPFDWYWEALSPKLADAGPGRLKPALDLLIKPPEGRSVEFPRLQALQDIARVHGIEILKATVGTQVSPALVLAVISVESSGRTDAISSAGASGLMQLMPATAERFGVNDVAHPPDNIKGGVAFLDLLMKQFDRDPALVLAAYNAGENSVKKYNGVPPFAETRAYVPKVLAAWTVARGLCLTPPELLSDGCVFVGLGAGTDG